VTATLVLGKHSGRHAVQRRCEQIGHTLDGHVLDQVYREVIAHADREKVVNDSDLTAIVTRVKAAAGGATERPKPATPPASQDFNSTPAEIGYGHGV
jgi:isopropylmalate/homocitrate/citramalate synthase